MQMPLNSILGQGVSCKMYRPKTKKTKETLAEWMKTREEGLIIDMHRHLNSYIQYYVDVGTMTLKPKDEKAALILEFGQPATGKPATMFLESAIEKWKKATDIKG
jgi:hypothetical protein